MLSTHFVFYKRETEPRKLHLLTTLPILVCFCSWLSTRKSRRNTSQKHPLPFNSDGTPLGGKSAQTCLYLLRKSCRRDSIQALKNMFNTWPGHFFKLYLRTRVHFVVCFSSSERIVFWFKSLYQKLHLNSSFFQHSRHLQFVLMFDISILVLEPQMYLYALICPHLSHIQLLLGDKLSKLEQSTVVANCITCF